jgi:hypothetical protein
LYDTVIVLPLLHSQPINKIGKEQGQKRLLDTPQRIRERRERGKRERERDRDRERER